MSAIITKKFWRLLFNELLVHFVVCLYAHGFIVRLYVCFGPDFLRVTDGFFCFTLW
jgi:hypothetical protein